MRSTRSYALLVAAFLTLSFGPLVADASADTVETCGTLEALQRPNGLEGVAGWATIDQRTYRLSAWLSSNSTNTIGRTASVGNHVCLRGDSTASASDVLTNYSLAGCGGGIGVVGCPVGAPVSFGPVLPFVWIAFSFGVLVIYGAARRHPAPARALTTLSMGTRRAVPAVRTVPEPRRERPAAAVLVPRLKRAS